MTSQTRNYLAVALAACGAGAIGPGLLMSASSRWIPETKRNMAAGIVNAGGSFGQFTITRSRNCSSALRAGSRRW